MPVPEGKPGSWEDVLNHELGQDKLLIFGRRQRTGAWGPRRGQRAIGVVYHPEFEYGNYVPTVLPSRYDALLYIDETHALRPLHMPAVEEPGEVPETYPTGV
jgi:erythromycin esterase-like protein